MKSLSDKLQNNSFEKEIGKKEVLFSVLKKLSILETLLKSAYLKREVHFKWKC